VFDSQFSHDHVTDEILSTSS